VFTEHQPATVSPAPGSTACTWWDVVTLSVDGMPTPDSFRQVGELGRVVPVFGMATGAAADTIGI
jgi:hypothetical protein